MKGKSKEKRDSVSDDGMGWDGMPYEDMTIVMVLIVLLMVNDMREFCCCSETRGAPAPVLDGTKRLAEQRTDQCRE